MASLRWRYRFWQGMTRLAADLGLRSPDLALAQRFLSPRAWDLFVRLSPGDQAHALCVLRRLMAMGEVSPWLAEAALLHDVGKTCAHLTLAHRTARVLLKRAPGFSRWAGAGDEGWRRSFYVQEHHARLGAAMCEAAGCDPRTVALVRWHEAPPDALPEPDLREALVRLQAADDAC